MNEFFSGILNKVRGRNFAIYFICLAMILVMASSIQHIQFVISLLEQSKVVSWLIAISIDLVIVSIAYSIGLRKKAKRPVWILWVAMGITTIASAVANLLHGLMVGGGVHKLADIKDVDPIVVGLSVFFGALLPLLVVVLSEILSSDDRYHIEQQEQLEAKQKAKEEREAKRQEREQDLEFKRLELEQQKLQQPEPTQQPVSNEIAWNDTKRQVYDLLASNSQLSNSQIAQQLGKSDELIRRYRKELEQNLSGNGHKALAVN